MCRYAFILYHSFIQAIDDQAFKILNQEVELVMTLIIIHRTAVGVEPTQTIILFVLDRMDLLMVQPSTISKDTMNIIHHHQFLQVIDDQVFRTTTKQ